MKKLTTFRIEEEYLEKLNAIAKKNGVSMAFLLRELVKNFLNEIEKDDGYFLAIKNSATMMRAQKP